MRGVVAIASLFVLLSFVAADLPSCERARCTHCESQFVARLCVDTCRLCHITRTDVRRPSIRGEPTSETGVIQNGLSNLQVISQQTNSAPVAQQPPHSLAPQPAQLPSLQAPQQLFNQQAPQLQQQQAPTQLYYPQQQQQQQVVQPQIQFAQPQPQQQQFVAQPQPQLQFQPQPQPQFYTFPPYQAPGFGAPGAQQSFFFNPFQPFLPYSPTPLVFPGQQPAVLPVAQPFGGFNLLNTTQTVQPSNNGFASQQQIAAGAGAGAGQQSQIPPSPPPPANLIDSQNYQYQKPVQTIAQPQSQNLYPQQITATIKKPTEPVNVQPQQVRTPPPVQAPQPEQHVVNTVKPALLTPPVEIKTTTTPAVLQCPRQPSWQPCISKDLANERFRNCCQRLGEGCVSLCSYDQNLTTIQIAVLTGRCPISKVADMMICASGYEDATPCCQAYNVFEPGFEHCKPYCNPAAGLPQGGMLSEQYKCLGKLSQIQQCFYVTQRP